MKTMHWQATAARNGEQVILQTTTTDSLVAADAAAGPSSLRHTARFASGADLADEEAPEIDEQKHRVLAAGAFMHHLLTARATVEHDLPVQIANAPAGKQCGPYGARGHSYELYVWEASASASASSGISA